MLDIFEKVRRRHLDVCSHCGWGLLLDERNHQYCCNLECNHMGHVQQVKRPRGGIMALCTKMS